MRQSSKEQVAEAAVVAADPHATAAPPLLALAPSLSPPDQYACTLPPASRRLKLATPSL